MVFKEWWDGKGRRKVGNRRGRGYSTKKGPQATQAEVATSLKAEGYTEDRYGNLVSADKTHRAHFKKIVYHLQYRRTDEGNWELTYRPWESYVTGKLVRT